MKYKLIEGDCLDILPTLEAGSVDLTVTSPPYDNLRDYGKDFDANKFDWKAIIKQLYRVTAVGGVVVWVVADATIKGSETGTSFRQALWAMECGFNLHDTMIYQTAKPPMNVKRYEPAFEYMFVWSKGQPCVFNPIMVASRYAGKSRSSMTYRNKNGNLDATHDAKDGRIRPQKIKTNIWDIKSGYGKSTLYNDAYQHPAIFPEQLAHDHIISWSNEGDTVLDPFLGSGTTGVAALRLNRKFIGIELDADYFALAETRIKNANNEFTMTTKEKASGQMGLL